MHEAPIIETAAAGCRCRVGVAPPNTPPLCWLLALLGFASSHTFGQPECFAVLGRLWAAGRLGALRARARPHVNDFDHAVLAAQWILQRGGGKSERRRYHAPRTGRCRCRGCAPLGLRRSRKFLCRPQFGRGVPLSSAPGRSGPQTPPSPLSWVFALLQGLACH